MAGQSGSVSAGTDTFERVFLCKGSSDPLKCRDALINQRVAINLDFFANLNLDTLAWTLQAADDAWRFVAAYTFIPQPGEFRIAMDSSGGTVNVTEAFAQVRTDAPGELGVDYKTSINVDGQGNPRGVDKAIPALKMNVVARIATVWVQDQLAYAKTISNSTGYTNNAEYLGFAIGELLFLGATGEIFPDNPLLTFTFAASPNLIDHDIGSITVPFKAGHDYIWFSYKTEKDPATDLNTQIATAAYVARVYGSLDFSVLKIGELN